MIRRLVTRGLAPVLAVAVTLGIVFVAASVRSHGTRSESAPAAAPVKISRITLTVPGLGTIPIEELRGITSEVQPMEFVATNGNSVVHTKQYGKTKPPTVTLVRQLGDGMGQGLMRWHMQATDGSPNARVTAQLTVTPTSGSPLVYTLEDAWLGKLEISTLKAGQSDVIEALLTIHCDQILVSS